MHRMGSRLQLILKQVSETGQITRAYKHLFLFGVLPLLQKTPSQRGIHISTLVLLASKYQVYTLISWTWVFYQVAEEAVRPQANNKIWIVN